MYLVRIKILRTRSGIKAAVLLTVVAAFFFVSACSRQPSKFNLKTMTAYEVTRGDLSEVISISGNLKAGEERKLTFPATVAGAITEVSVGEGQKVDAGDVLVKVDDTKQKLSLDQAESALAQAQSALNTARINYQSALDSNHTTIQITQSNYDLAKKQISAAKDQVTAAQDALYYTEKQLIEAQNNYNEVVSYNDSQSWDTAAEKHTAELNEISARSSLAASEKEYIAAVDAVTTAQNSLKQAKESRDAAYWTMIQQQQAAAAQIKLTSEAINNAVAAHKSAEASVELAKISLSDTVLKAPFNGTISALTFKEGEQVGITSSINLVDISKLHVEALVDEIDVIKIKPGDEVDISVDAYPYELIRGVVTYIAPTSTDLQGVVSYLTKFDLKDYGDLILKPGMTASVDVEIIAAESVLYVPGDFIFNKDGKSYVKLLGEGDVIGEVEIQTGYASSENTEITSGLNVGDRIIKENK